MEAIVKAVSTFVNDKLDQILTADKFGGELGTFINEYLHEHPDEIDNIYAVIKCSNPSFSEISERGKMSFIKKKEKSFSMIKNKFLKPS